MQAWISKSDISGTASAPSSKSYTIRGLMCGALARGKSQVVYPLGSDDTAAAMRVLKQVGARIRRGRDVWNVNGSDFQSSSRDLYCGDSAATLRFMTALCSLIPGTSRLTAGESLAKRPVQPLVDALRQLGVNCSAQGGLPPVTVAGGRLGGGVTSLPGDISSQYVSALLMVAPFAESVVTIRLTTALESRPYVLMTLDAMQCFNVTVAFSDSLDEFEIMPQTYEPARFVVEGDWTSASSLLALGALAGAVEVANLPTETMQGDRTILSYLEQMGALVQYGHNSVSVVQSSLRPLAADLTESIDLLPTVAVLAAMAGGSSVLSGIARARLKESDRVAAMREGLARLGIGTEETHDSLTITGSRPVGALVSAHGDHRIAMAFSLLGAVVGDVVIDGAECVAKTYPEYWDVFQNLGGKVQFDGK